MKNLLALIGFAMLSLFVPPAWFPTRPVLAQAEIAWDEEFLKGIARERALANLSAVEHMSYGIQD